MRRKQDTSFRVEAATELMPFLLSKLGGMTRTSVKQLLSQRRVTVNAGIQTRHDTPLKAGDMINILQGRGNVELRHPKLRIIYEDDALIVVEKKNGLLTVPYNPKSSEMTVLSILKDYVKKQSRKANVYVVHRLDRETSGVLVFAKSPELQEYMRTYWRQLVSKRTYVALVEGILEKKEGIITSWLTEDQQTLMVYSSQTDNGGQKAITHYKVVKESAMPSAEQDLATEYSLVELNLETGRTNQIRVHMQSIGHPVVGDRKYGNGNESSPVDRLCLHAKVLEFIHPMTEKKVRFEAAAPKEMLRMFNSSL
ncbi:MAG: RluA family pseudouridine synthase [Paludibacteraceae bacterium]|nr:RluA family pseudouridine synthase [Paludibacteraceae bacterium]